MFEAFGITDAGFNLPTFLDVQAEVRAELGTRLGYTVDDSTTLAGIMADIMAEALTRTWEEHYNTWLSFQLAASGVSLENVVQQVGIYPRANVKSTGSVQLIGTPGSEVPAGKRFRDAATGDVWETTATGDAGAPGDTVGVQAVEAGPVDGGPTHTYEIVTAVNGWTGVTWIANATIGFLTESPSELRARHASLMTGDGKATAEGVPIRAAVLAANGVTDAAVEINDTSGTVNGVPGYHIRVTALGGTDEAVAQAIWNSKRLGGGTDGAVSVVVTDDDGEDHTVKFQRPSNILINVEIALQTTSLYPVDGNAQISTIVQDYIAGLGIGVDVSHPGLFSTIYSQVPGIFEMVLLLAVDPASATPDTITIDLDEISVFNDLTFN